MRPLYKSAITSGFVTADKIHTQTNIDKIPVVEIVESDPESDLNPLSKIAEILMNQAINAGNWIEKIQKTTPPKGDDLERLYMMQDAIWHLDGVITHIGTIIDRIKSEYDAGIEQMVEVNAYESDSFFIEPIHKRNTRYVDTKKLPRHILDELRQTKLRHLQTTYTPTITELKALIGDSRSKVYLTEKEPEIVGYEVRPKWRDGV